MAGAGLGGLAGVSGGGADETRRRRNRRRAGPRIFTESARSRSRLKKDAFFAARGVAGASLADFDEPLAASGSRSTDERGTRLRQLVARAGLRRLRCLRRSFARDAAPRRRSGSRLPNAAPPPRRQPEGERRVPARERRARAPPPSPSQTLGRRARRALRYASGDDPTDVSGASAAAASLATTPSRARVAADAASAPRGRRFGSVGGAFGGLIGHCALGLRLPARRSSAAGRAQPPARARACLRRRRRRRRRRARARAASLRAAPGDVRGGPPRTRRLPTIRSREDGGAPSTRSKVRGAVAAEPAERRERPRVLDAFPVRLCEACLEIGNHARLHERLRGGGRGRGKTRRVVFRFRAGKNFRRARRDPTCTPSPLVLPALGAARARAAPNTANADAGRRAVVGRRAAESRFVAKRATVAVAPDDMSSRAFSASSPSFGGDSRAGHSTWCDRSPACFHTRPAASCG